MIKITKLDVTYPMPLSERHLHKTDYDWMNIFIVEESDIPFLLKNDFIMDYPDSSNNIQDIVNYFENLIGKDEDFINKKLFDVAYRISDGLESDKDSSAYKYLKTVLRNLNIDKTLS